MRIVIGLLIFGFVAGSLAAQSKESSEPPKPADPARALGERIARHAGGPEALAGLRHVAFREITSTSRRGRVTENTSRWLLAPAAKRVRWESVPVPVQPAIPMLGVPRDVMVLNTETRSNLLTVPATKQKVSLWSQWHRVQRLIFLPFVILDANVELHLLPVQKTDPVGVRRLRAVWPKTRNYTRTDEHELHVEVDTGRIARVVEVTGSRGQNRATYDIGKWTKIGKLRLPANYKLREGRGRDVTFDEIRVDVAVPKDVWKTPKRIIEKLRSKPKAKTGSNPKR